MDTLINSIWPSLSAARQSSALIKQAFLDRHVASLLAMTNKSAVPYGLVSFHSEPGAPHLPTPAGNPETPAP
ncbi:MAG: hypothetical protein U0938_11785 [Thiobacillus sp.]|nr:hypothetical protein [Thiobacillus sp.]